jgi:hypothetical protein
VRRKYGVEMPSWKTSNRILEDFPRVTGQQLNFHYNDDQLMSFWRQNKEAYDFREAEDAREHAFFHMRVQEEGGKALKHRLCE